MGTRVTVAHLPHFRPRMSLPWRTDLPSGCRVTAPLQGARSQGLQSRGCVMGGSQRPCSTTFAILLNSAGVTDPPRDEERTLPSTCPTPARVVGFGQAVPPLRSPWWGWPRGTRRVWAPDNSRETRPAWGHLQRPWVPPCQPVTMATFPWDGLTPGEGGFLGDQTKYLFLRTGSNRWVEFRH